MRIEVSRNVVLTDADVSVQTARSGGAGGQHVNKTESKVLLRFRLSECDQLRAEVKARLAAAHPGKLTDAGELLVTCDANRDQHRNLLEACDKLAAMVRAALIAPKKRHDTKPTKGSKRRRLETKKQRGETKRQRGRVDVD